MSFHAQGTFTVDSWEDQKPPQVEGRQDTLVVFTRAYSGDLSGTGRCHSTTSSSGPGHVGRLAIEMFEGILHGRTGGFMMTYRNQRGEAVPWLHWIIDRGTGELAGITGRARVVMNDDECSYTLDYDFADPAAQPPPDEETPKRHFWQRRGRG